ncbi:MAG: hypothetical protein LBH60_04925 [Prevotellaceae bacterium]|jgi:hypothetical protein|nr:hypothetical protein [Prevotellaceae bacterium]
MTGKLYIDGKDAYSLYGVFITGGGYNELVEYPSLKKVDSNDWAEEDGIESDLSSPVLDTRELNIKFSYKGANARFGAFIELISDMAYHTFNFQEIRKTYRLRLVSQPNLSRTLSLGLFALRFADDFPLDGYTYQAPSSTIIQQTGYELDDRSLSDYGVCVLQGSEAEIIKSPAVKKNLLQNIASRRGAIYDGEFVVFQTKEVKLNCLMRAKTLQEFWWNYNALLYDLTRPGERMLYVDSTGYEYPCYYKSCSVDKFFPTGKIWFQFSVVLVFTSFRVSGEEFLLASEDDFLIITEQDDYALNLSIYGD